MLEVSDARKRLPKVSLSDELEREGLRWIEALKIDSHRAEMTLFEAGRALAAIDGRLEVTIEDLRTVAPLALRQRQTEIAAEFFEKQQTEDDSRRPDPPIVSLSEVVRGIRAGGPLVQ